MFDRFLFHKHLEEEESVSKIVHQYWVIGARMLFWPVLFFIAGCVFLAAAPQRLTLIVVALWSIAMIVWGIRNFLDYYLDAWIVTDQGVIALEWLGFFHRQSSRILYSDIQGVSYEIHGIIGTLSRYGTLSIEKISTGATLSLAYVQHPRSIESLILKNMEEYLYKKNLKNAKHVQNLLSEFVAEKMQLQETMKESDKKKPNRRSPLTSRRV